MSYITRQAAAERLSIGLRTLDRMIARGQFPAYRIGSKIVRIDEKDIEEYMAGRRVAPEKQSKAAPVQRVCRYVPGMKVV